MNIYQNATIETLGESRKTSECYTKYDYIELSINGQLIQIPSVLVHDSVNAGLIAGLKADIFFAEYYLYSIFSRATLVTECVALKNQAVERNYYAMLMDQVKKRPTLLGVFPWMICMPIRALRTSNGSYNPIGVLILVYWVVILAPFVTPFTYHKRRKRHADLRLRLKAIDASSNADSSFRLPDDLISTGV